MTDSGVLVLVITGSVGVGKSSTADVISEILRKRDVPHAVIDMDYLRYAFPRPADDPFHRTLGAKNLASVWKNYQSIGVRNIIIPNIVEDKADVDAIAKAIPGAKVFVVRLKASLDTIHNRLHERHHNRDSDNLNWHLDRADELTKQLESSKVEDFVVDTDDKPLREIAKEILVKWLSN